MLAAYRPTADTHFSVDVENVHTFSDVTYRPSTYATCTWSLHPAFHLDPGSACSSGCSLAKPLAPEHGCRCCLVPLLPAVQDAWNIDLVREETPRRRHFSALAPTPAQEIWGIDAVPAEAPILRRFLALALTPAQEIWGIDAVPAEAPICRRFLALAPPSPQEIWRIDVVYQLRRPRIGSDLPCCRCRRRRSGMLMSFQLRRPCVGAHLPCCRRRRRKSGISMPPMPPEPPRKSLAPAGVGIGCCRWADGAPEPDVAAVACGTGWRMEPCPLSAPMSGSAHGEKWRVASKVGSWTAWPGAAGWRRVRGVERGGEGSGERQRNRMGWETRRACRDGAAAFGRMSIVPQLDPLLMPLDNLECGISVILQYRQKCSGYGCRSRRKPCR
eukprot:363308-Chlamydomonas_euryale.AAC.8